MHVSSHSSESCQSENNESSSLVKGKECRSGTNWSCRKEKQCRTADQLETKTVSFILTYSVFYGDLLVTCRRKRTTAPIPIQL